MYEFWVYSDDNTDPTELRVFDTSNDTSHMLEMEADYRNDRFIHGPSWSPTQDLLLLTPFRVDRGPRDGLITGPKGENPILVPQASHPLLADLLWSPTGEAVLVGIAVNNETPERDLFVIDLDTQQRTKIGTISEQIIGWLP